MQPEGTYFGQVKSGTLTQSSTGTANMAVQFTVTSFAANGQWQPLLPQTERTIYLSFSDKAMEYTESKLLSLGFNGDFNSPNFSDEAKHEGVELVCRHEEYQGKTREKWDLANWGGGGAAEQAPADLVRQVSALWKSRQAKSKPPAGKPAPPPPQPKRTPPPPPTSSPSQQPQSKATPQDEAWAEVSAAWPKEPAKAEAAWLKAIGDRDPATLTAADWAAVADEASLPF